MVLGQLEAVGSSSDADESFAGYETFAVGASPDHDGTHAQELNTAATMFARLKPYR